MPDPRRRTCQACGKDRSEVGLISWRGLCVGCAVDHVSVNVDGIYHKRGTPWRRWREGMAACVGAELLDAPRDDGHA